MLKIFRGWHWTTKIFNMKILITRINLWNEFFFVTLGNDAVQAHTSYLSLLDQVERTAGEALQIRSA